jgi:chromosome partitioning protein
MRKIAVALSKGGVGKTTTAVNLGAGLAEMGARVLLIDMDTQGQAAKALGVTPKTGIADVVSEGLLLPEAVFAARERLWLLAGGRSLVGVKREIARKDFGGERTISDALAALEGQYDYVILDTAPGWDSLTINALFYVNEVIAPVSLEAMALQGLREFGASLGAIQRYHQQLGLTYILPTFMDGRVKKSQQIYDLLQEYYSERVCEPIRYNVRLSEAPGLGKTIFEYAPRSIGAENYRSLVARVVGDDTG